MSSSAGGTAVRVMIVDGSADVRSALGESVTRGGLLLAGTAISERTASAKFESYLREYEVE